MDYCFRHWWQPCAKMSGDQDILDALILTVFQSCSPLRVEQRKLQDRLAALERLTREHAAQQATTKNEGDLSKGMPGGRGGGSFFTLSENTTLRVKGRRTNNFKSLSNSQSAWVGRCGLSLDRQLCLKRA